MLQNRQKFLVNPVFHKLQISSNFVLVQEIEKDKATFKGFYSMYGELFKKLAKKFPLVITKKD